MVIIRTAMLIRCDSARPKAEKKKSKCESNNICTTYEIMDFFRVCIWVKLCNSKWFRALIHVYGIHVWLCVRVCVRVQENITVNWPTGKMWMIKSVVAPQYEYERNCKDDEDDGTKKRKDDKRRERKKKNHNNKMKKMKMKVAKKKWYTFIAHTITIHNLLDLLRSLALSLSLYLRVSMSERVYVCVPVRYRYVCVCMCGDERACMHGYIEIESVLGPRPSNIAHTNTERSQYCNLWINYNFLINIFRTTWSKRTKIKEDAPNSPQKTINTFRLSNISFDSCKRILIMICGVAALSLSLSFSSLR